MKLYDPNDPTTYPGYHSSPTTTPDVDVPNTFANMQQTGGLGGNTLANMQTSRPQGYHGLPTV
jgi:hypothetical protein